MRHSRNNCCLINKNVVVLMTKSKCDIVADTYSTWEAVDVELGYVYL